MDISRAIPVITKAIDNKNPEISWCAVWIVEAAAKNGVDISIAVPNLIRVLLDEHLNVRLNGVYALTYHFITKKKWKELEELIQYPDIEIQKNVVLALIDATKKKKHIPGYIIERIEKQNI